MKKLINKKIYDVDKNILEYISVSNSKQFPEIEHSINISNEKI